MEPSENKSRTKTSIRSMEVKYVGKLNYGNVYKRVMADDDMEVVRVG